MNYRRRLAVAALGLVPFANAVVAAETPSCGTFTVLAEADTREFVDLGAEGATTGDQRIGRYRLLDLDGTPLGVMHFVATVMPPWENGENPVFAVAHYNFANGAITTLSVVGLPDTADTGKGPDQDLDYAVTGGTGAFAGATGTMSSQSNDADQRQMTFTLTCQD